MKNSFLKKCTGIQSELLVDEIQDSFIIKELEWKNRISTNTKCASAFYLQSNVFQFGAPMRSK